MHEGFDGDRMNLQFPCAGCQTPIQYSASKCAKCGRKVSEEDIKERSKTSQTSMDGQSWLGCAALIGAISVFAYLIFSQNPEDKERFRRSIEMAGVERSAQDDIKAILRDPESALFSSITVSERNSVKVVCGVVNSQNGFGGMTGGKRFISSPGIISVIEGENMQASEFQGSWNTFC